MSSPPPPPGFTRSIVPTVGRIVHYGREVGKLVPLAAIITQVQPRSLRSPELAPEHEKNWQVALYVFNPLSEYRSTCWDIPYSETLVAGHWSWPPRTP